LTISNFSCCSLFVKTREITDCKIGVDKHQKMTETTGTTDGKTGGDRPSNEKIEIT
jgi:hypothetical protein